MDKETQLWNQYASLREEINASDALCFQVLGIVIGAVTTILAASLGQVNPLFRFFTFLCVYIITIPGYKILEGKRRCIVFSNETWKEPCRGARLAPSYRPRLKWKRYIWRISTYTRVFLERELQFIKWETRIDQQRKKADNENSKQSFSSLVGTNEWWILTSLNWLAAFAAIFGGLWQINTTPSIKILALPVNTLLFLKIVGTIVVLIGNVYLMWRLRLTERNLRRLGKVEQSYLKSWEIIRLEEDQLNN